VRKGRAGEKPPRFLLPVLGGVGQTGFIPIESMKKLLLAASVFLFAVGPANAQLGVADTNQQDVDRYTGKRSDFDAFCGTALREQQCKVQIFKDRLVVNEQTSIPISSIREVVYSRGGDDPGGIGHRLWGKWYDQTGVFYVDANGNKKLAVFGFRHAATWMHFNLNLVSAKNGIYFD
jgi:hypothetical protein